MPRSASEYADVTEMFRQLAEYESRPATHRRYREEIIQRTLPLADHIACRFRNRGEDLDDLRQAARVGLINAVNRFDPENGSDFLSFAVPTITGEVRRHFRDHAWALKVPRRLKDIHGQLSAARSELAQQIGRSPTATELATHAGVERETVIDWQIASSNYTTLSIDKPVTGDDEHTSIVDTLGSVDPGIDKIIDSHAIRPLIAALPERERTVLELRFFQELTQTQIAGHVGCSQMHVSRLLAKALRTLRTQVGQSGAVTSEAGLAATA